MFKRILVPVDGSAPSDKALATALRLAKEQRAAVRMLHVTDVLPPAYVEGTYVDVDMYRDSVLTVGRDVISAPRPARGRPVYGRSPRFSRRSCTIRRARSCAWRRAGAPTSS